MPQILTPPGLSAPPFMAKCPAPLAGGRAFADLSRRLPRRLPESQSGPQTDPRRNIQTL